MIEVTRQIRIPESELEESFIRASGPGGQNVNKVASAVQLRFAVRTSPSLPPDIRARAERLAGNRLTNDGDIVITAERYRSQDRNREDARKRLGDLLKRAARPPKIRKPTRPTLGSKKRRLEAKTRRGNIKKLRGAPNPE